jgi:hypothetical protein
LLPSDSTIEWIGNEVSCGVGMQRIDVMLSVMHREQRIVIPVELKTGQPDAKNVRQIQRYIDWIEQYYLPNRQSDIQPVLIAEKVANPRSNKYRETVESFGEFNRSNENRCNRLKYFGYEVTANSIDFGEIPYA